MRPRNALYLILGLLLVAGVVGAIAHSANGVIWTPDPPPDVSAQTTDSSGTAVSYSAPTATDSSTPPNPLTVVCSPGSGTTFPVGTTPVTCDAQDASSTTLDTTSFNVNVTFVDTVPPVVTVPSDMTVSATGSSTPVSFSASATDNVDGAVPVSCSPSSGSGFAVGTTTVTCTATDSSGNTGSASFHVTVQDTTPPNVNISGVQTWTATGPSGATVTYTASATDDVDGNLTPTCSPASGSTFPPGTTTVTCTATDSSGNTGSASMDVSVVDTAPTIMNVPANIVAEASSAKGAPVIYTPPSATDIVDGGDPITCTPDTGAIFPLGDTTVNCTATNSSGQTATATFTVTVQDTTPPVLPKPGTLSLTSTDPVPITYLPIQRFLALQATDLVDPKPIVTNNAPTSFPFGTTVVTFTATDASGNTSTAQGQVVVSHVVPAAGTTAPATAVVASKTSIDRVAPANVGGLSVRVIGRTVYLRWKLPTDADFDHIQVSRQRATLKPLVVYRGKGTRFIDHRLTVGITYRYLVVSFDRTGNQSVGVVALATAKPQLLYGPSEGARVTTPVVFHWRAKPRSTFYNLQVYRGKTKIFSAWPKRPKLVLPGRWHYGGKLVRLTPGLYQWFVWPASGTRTRPHYGPIEGGSNFVVVKRKKKKT
jgi:hypothetical protein